MSSSIEKIFRPLTNAGWTVNFREQPSSLPASIKTRYPWIDKSTEKAISTIELAINNKKDLWVLSTDDYYEKSDSEFTWNEWEKQSIESAGNDKDWIKEIKNFWDKNFPIAISVSNSYSYLALQKNGAIVIGHEPEYEIIYPYSPSYEKAIYKLATTGMIND
jgi:hypothetical protein